MHNRPLSSIFTLPPVQTHTFTTSWLLPPLALGLLRLLIFTYCFSNQLACWIYYATHDSAELIGQQFSYFTNLTFWGILFYSLVAGVHTLVYRVRGRSWLDSWPRALRQLHSLFYTTIVTLPFLVTLVYWIVLYEGPWFPVVFDGYSNISRHALNSLFALFELVLAATVPPPFLHLVGLILILLLYLALAYLTHATQGFYVYSFLNPNTNGPGRVAGYAFGIAAAVVVIFLVVRLLIWLRHRFTADAKRSPRDVPRSRSMDLEVEMSSEVEGAK